MADNGEENGKQKTAKTDSAVTGIASGFKKLIEAQNETTRQLMSDEERAADDAKKAEQARVRSDAAKKGHETRVANQQNQAALAIAEGQEEGQEESTSFLGRIAKQFDVQGQFRARQAEAKSKEESQDKKDTSFLKRMAGGITDIAKSAGEKVKAGLSGFSKFAFGALALAALAFLNNPKFEEIKNTIIDTIVPLLAKLYDNVIKPLAIYIGGKLMNLLNDLKAYIDGDKGLGDVILDNIGVIAGIVTALAPGLVFGALKTAVLGIGKALLWISAKGGITSLIMGGFAAIKSFFVVTLLPFLTALAIPIGIIVGVVATIALVAWSLKQAFDDFMFELEATGSAWEAVKTFIVSLFANIPGTLANLIKDGISWIIRKIGETFGIESFTNAADAMDKFDFVEYFKEGLEWMGNWISGMFDTAVNWLKEKGRSLLNVLGLSSDWLGTKEEDEAKDAAKAREKEEREKEYQRKREELKAKKKLEEEKELAAKKKEQELKAQQTAPAAASLNVSAFGNLGMGAPIVNAPVSNRSTNTSNHISSSSTSLINQDRIFDKLSFVG
tara:strand:- start:522 stop:2192 length:1671 start_codon:yes stop_codon:yes gene_type:complete